MKTNIVLEVGEGEGCAMTIGYSRVTAELHLASTQEV